MAVDIQTQIQMVNYAIVEATMNGGTTEEYKKAVEFLKKNGIETIPNKRVFSRGERPINTTYLRTQERKIRATGDLTLPPKFNGKLGPRTEKDKMYERIWTMVDAFIGQNEQKRYIGLAGTYLPMVKRALGKNSMIVCCENNREHKAWLDRLWKEFLQGQAVSIQSKNILKFIETTEMNPNIIDLDLMRCLNNNLVDQIVNAVSLTDKEVSNHLILNVVACVGRGNTWTEHNQSIEHMRNELQNHFWIKAETSGNYLERHHPIAYNVFVLV